MSDYLDNANAILGQLRLKLPAAVQIDRAKSGEHLDAMFESLPCVVLILDTEEPRHEARPTGTRRQNVDRTWSVYVAGYDPDDAGGSVDLYTLLEAVDDALRGFRVVPEGPLVAGEVRSHGVLAGGLIYRQQWTHWRQGRE